MKFVRVTHEYILPVPEGDVETLDATINAGVSMIERDFMSRIKNAREFRSNWEIIGGDDPQANISVDGADEVTLSHGRVPRRYADDSGLTAAEKEQDRITSLAAIEADTDEGINFARDVMGQHPGAMHPWDQGLWIFPEGHPLRELEGEYRTKYLDPRYKAHLKPILIQEFRGLSEG